MAQQAEEEAYERFLIPPRIPSKKKISFNRAHAAAANCDTEAEDAANCEEDTEAQDTRRLYRDKILQKNL